MILEKAEENLYYFEYMKTFYLSTLLLIILIGTGIYFSTTYQNPDLLAGTTSTTTPAPTSSPIATPIISTTSATPPPFHLEVNSQTPIVAPITPNAPVNFKITATSPTQADLSWDPPANTAGIAGYAVYRNFVRIGITPDTVFSDADYSSQYTYSYNVTSYSKSGLQSAYSDTITIEGNLGTPPATNPNSTTVAIIPSAAPSPTTPAAAPTPVATPTPTPSPKPASGPACGSGGSCTAAQIAVHTTRGDCWVYLSQINKAYNITAYVQDPSQHPGGDVIVSHCGTDIYNYFLGSAGGHKHSSNALNNVLQAYYIGPMQ
jgi:hypothetical protein